MKTTKLDLTEKVCKNCGWLKPASEFYRTKGYLTPKCKRCTGKKSRLIVEINPDYKPNLPQGEYVGNTAGLNATYSTTANPKSYPKTSPKSGKCELCDNERRLVHDHCHATGKFRGKVCYSCNRRLGGLDEYWEWYHRAIAYVKRHQREL